MTLAPGGAAPAPEVDVDGGDALQGGAAGDEGGGDNVVVEESKGKREREAASGRCL